MTSGLARGCVKAYWLLRLLCQVDEERILLAKLGSIIPSRLESDVARVISYNHLLSLEKITMIRQNIDTRYRGVKVSIIHY